ncbi:MAG: hypothetical protein V1929_02765, partial [bacterium]
DELAGVKPKPPPQEFNPPKRYAMVELTPWRYGDTAINTVIVGGQSYNARVLPGKMVEAKILFGCVGVSIPFREPAEHDIAVLVFIPEGDAT